MREYTTVNVSTELAKLLKARAVTEDTTIRDLLERFIVTCLKLPPDQIVKPPESTLPPAYARLPELIAAPRHRRDKLLLEMIRITLDSFDEED